MRHFVLGILMLIPVSALAHGGHDHSHWSSSAIHSLLAMALVGTALVIGAVIVKKVANKSTGGDK